MIGPHMKMFYPKKDIGLSEKKAEKPTISNVSTLRCNQQELIRQIFNDVKEKFPETEFISVTEGPENPADLWINITAP